jgi:hypothetical protein
MRGYSVKDRILTGLCMTTTVQRNTQSSKKYKKDEEMVND